MKVSFNGIDVIDLDASTPDDILFLYSKIADATGKVPEVPEHMRPILRTHNRLCISEKEVMQNDNKNSFAVQ